MVRTAPIATRPVTTRTFEVRFSVQETPKGIPPIGIFALDASSLGGHKCVRVGFSRKEAGAESGLVLDEFVFMPGARNAGPALCRSTPMHALTFLRISPLLLPMLFLAAPAAGGVLDGLFAPKPQLWARWSAHDARSGKRVDHGAWDRFLSAYVSTGRDGVALVAYGRVSGKEKKALDDYVAELADLPISGYSRSEQLAYWVNLYNALTVKTVLDHYPVKSIRDIDLSSGPFSGGPWKRKLVQIEGQGVSLDDIEHRILRPIWKDPRIHYVLNCASIGCPNLQALAFSVQDSQRLLDKAARAYVNSRRGVQVVGARLILSSIYAWFEPDFAVDGGVLAHLKRYAAPALKGRLDGFDAVDDYIYDWRLNEAR